MAYHSPHHAREFLVAASLAVVHDYALRCQRRTVSDKKELLANTREIDLCSRLASFFGPVAHLAAQGTRDIDLVVAGPTIRAEIKYFRPPAGQWVSLRKDWDWLLDVPSANDEFRKRAWVVFWPSASAKMYKFTNCISVTRSHGNQFSLEDFAPFAPYTEPVLPLNGEKQRLRFKEPDRLTILQMPHGKRVRVDIVGAQTGPLWCAIYTRTLQNASPAENVCQPIQITNAPIQVHRGAV